MIQAHREREERAGGPQDEEADVTKEVVGAHEGAEERPPRVHA